MLTEEEEAEAIEPFCCAPTVDAPVEALAAIGVAVEATVTGEGAATLLLLLLMAETESQAVGHPHICNAALRPILL